MAALDIAREIAQLRATPGANWLAQALQKIADHVNAPVPVPPEPPAPKPVTLASLLPPGTTLLTAGSAAPGHPTGATGTLLSVPVSSGTVITDLSNPDNQGSAPVSVGLTMPSDFTVTGSPAQNNQTIAVTRTTETANTVLAGPSSGAAAVPTYRALVAADIPAPAGDVTGTYAATTVVATHLTDPLPVAQGGTGTATPATVAGTGITVSGSFPGQTVALTTPVAVADGGTGTATPGIAFGACPDFNGSDTITSAPPMQSENVGWKGTLFGDSYAFGISSFTWSVLTPSWLSIFSEAPANDGTATVPDSHATASLGTDGSLRGSFVNVTTANSSAALAFTVYKDLGNIGGSLWFYNAAGSVSYGGLGFAGKAANYLPDAVPGDIVWRCDTSGSWLRLTTNAGVSTQAALDANGQWRFQFQTNAGEPTTTPSVGNAVFDTTNNKLWVYTSAGWKGVALS